MYEPEGVMEASAENVAVALAWVNQEPEELLPSPPSEPRSGVSKVLQALAVPFRKLAHALVN